MSALSRMPTRLLPLRPIIEANDLSHDKRGLVTRTRFGDYAKASGPEFGVTLNPARSLDGSNEVIGIVTLAVGVAGIVLAVTLRCRTFAVLHDRSNVSPEHVALPREHADQIIVPRCIV